MKDLILKLFAIGPCTRRDIAEATGRHWHVVDTHIQELWSTCRIRLSGDYRHTHGKYPVSLVWELV